MNAIVPPNLSTVPSQNPVTLHLPVAGLHCAGCVRKTERALAAVPGAETASVNLVTGIAEVRGRGADLAAGARAAIVAAGFAVPDRTEVLAVDGATCASCVKRIETALAAVPGVRTAAMNLATGRASVTVAGGEGDPDALVAALSRVGYAARPVTGLVPTSEPADAPGTASGDPHARRFWTAAALTLPVFAMEMGGHLIPAMHHWLHTALGPTMPALIQFVLTTLVLAGPGRDFYQRGIPGL